MDTCGSECYCEGSVYVSTFLLYLFVARDGGGNYSDSANERDDHNTRLMQSTEYPALAVLCGSAIYRERECLIMFLNVTLSRSKCYPGIHLPDNVCLNKYIYSILKIIAFFHYHLGQDFHNFLHRKHMFFMVITCHLHGFISQSTTWQHWREYLLMSSVLT